MAEDELPCSIWQVSPDRFAIAPLGKITPTFGLVIRNKDSKWLIQRKGKILATRYNSRDEAILALIALR